VFDHVGIAVADLAKSERFYRTVLSVLGAEPSHADAELVEWDDWAIGPTDREHPVTRGLHVGFRAPSREAVDAFWQAGIDAGYRDDGAPGPRTVYGPDYCGGFLLDPDGNSAEAVHTEREDPVLAGRVDHLWIRVRDPAASKRFYTTIAPHAGLRIGVDEPDHVLGMDAWGWEQLAPWLEMRLELPVGPLFCIVTGATRGWHWANAAARADLRRTAARAGVRRRFAPHQLRHAHAVEMAREGVPLIVIQRQLGHSNLGITSIYLQGIDNAEIIETVHARRAPMIQVSTLPRR